MISGSKTISRKFNLSLFTVLYALVLKLLNNFSDNCIQLNIILNLGNTINKEILHTYRIVQVSMEISLK